MMLAPAPFLLKEVSVRRVMTQVCIALLPGIAAYTWLIGPAILVQLVIASLTALLAEAVMLKVRGKPLPLFLADGSALVTAWLIALVFPPPARWGRWAGCSPSSSPSTSTAVSARTRSTRR